jgi:hypothetical protein
VNWLLLVSTLPGQNGALRISVWRALKALGVGLLRDGVYVMPDRPDLATALQALERDVVGSGGTAYLLRIQGRSDDEDARLCALFDRSAEYRGLIETAQALVADAATRSEADARRAVRQLRRDSTALEAIDFFGSPERDRLRRMMEKLDALVVSTFSPDEPRAVDALVERRDRKDFQHRRWATRRRLWVDRVSSAWLIRRFIDERPAFVWLDDTNRIGKGTVGFDFDGAAFTHAGRLTTFEVLALAFGLDEDRAVAKIGALVHYLDVGGAPIPEAAGFEAILSGMRDRTAGDDQLLDGMSPVLDSLYESFASPVPRIGVRAETLVPPATG